MSLRIALLQLQPSGWDQATTLTKATSFCHRAADLGADIIVFPEMWNIGYQFPERSEELSSWESRAICEGGEYIAQFQELARDRGIAILVTYLRKAEGKPTNAATLIDRRGEAILTYEKVHTCSFSPEQLCQPGQHFPVVALQTAKGVVQVGVMICFDREFPESARILMLGGAELILVPNACELEQNRLAQLQTRAFENMTAIAVANYAKPPYNGSSVAFQPIAFDKQGQSQKLLVKQGGMDEEIVLAEFDLEAIRAYRKVEVWGDKFRRPALYRALV